LGLEAWACKHRDSRWKEKWRNERTVALGHCHTKFIEKEDKIGRWRWKTELIVSPSKHLSDAYGVVGETITERLMGYTVFAPAANLINILCHYLT
jgi:hypothetical protein